MEKNRNYISFEDLPQEMKDEFTGFYNEIGRVLEKKEHDPALILCVLQVYTFRILGSQPLDIRIAYLGYVAEAIKGMQEKENEERRPSDFVV